MPGATIKKYRELKSYSQKYVAAKLGISQNAYSKIENGLTQLTVHHVKELSKILDVAITELLNDDFQIHKPFPQHRHVTKAELLQQLKQFEAKLQEKHASRHEAYVVATSLLAAAEQALGVVH